MLNNEQQKAVYHEFGSALIVAGPGSGKTTVITHHIDYLIKHLKFSPSEILVISFSKAAANEMKLRYKQLNPNSFYDVTFGTFHSVFLKFIRNYSFNIPRLIDEKERDGLIKKLTENTDSFEKLSTYISYKKSFISTSFRTDDTKLELLFNEYENLIKELDLMDFDDILIRCYKMVQSNSSIRQLIKNRFKAILIDEFQDINEYQYETIKLISDNNIYAVGDEDQSIYSFRGSQCDIMEKFNDEFKNVSLYNLATNYRCHSDIIDASQIVIKHNYGRFNDYVPIAIKNNNGLHFEVYKAKNKRDETEYLNKIIKSTNNKNNIAILVRTNNDVINYRNSILNYTKSVSEQIKNSINNIIYSYLSYVLYKSEKDLYAIINIPNRSIPRSVLSKDFQDLTINKKIIFSNEIEKLEKHFKVLSFSSPQTFCLYLWNIINVKSYMYEMFLDVEKESINNNFNEIIQESKNYNSISAFFSYLKSLKEQNELAEYHELSNLKIMTFHASKGLEFDHVLIPSVIEGVIPGRMSIGNMNIDEERRLFYVAMTRAKDFLGIITLENSESAKYIPSRFLDGLI